MTASYEIWNPNNKIEFNAMFCIKKSFINGITNQGEKKSYTKSKFTFAYRLAIVKSTAVHT